MGHSNLPLRPDNAHDSSTIACDSSSRRSRPPGKIPATAMLMAAYRAFRKTAARIAARIVPPASRTETAANCAAPAKVVAVSPLVEGAVVKGPTEAFMVWAGFELTAAGIAGYYGEVLDGMVTDERDAGGLPVLITDTLMGDAAARRRVAEETLRFAESLA